MDGENKFFLGVWSIVGIAFIALISIIGGCTIQQNELIAKNPDPIAASCAINGNAQVCMAVAMRKTQ